ncbi:ubiquitin, putative [Entamoeba dispar SAW760]|uniref:Ubiquitin, putative n=1 Tax=Entamoeba dispar (strain ATCC PRA-260 / SAW760) TaxID=370354 RepID=B0EDP9_ENTDS|nr:ubiquitin, putative [Entamoeba dispar SAW760]EDR27347.1 ubiquitin, putative [Entamoeba dispar SAW760]|eukprot:EDR27347.1 ubiquitin, putative [Entamoeba dispar SAW760]
MSCSSNTLGISSFVLFKNLSGMQKIEDQERERTEYEKNHPIKIPENEKEFIEEYDNLITEIDTQRKKNQECLGQEWKYYEVLKRITETYELVIKKRENQAIETGKLKNQIIDRMINIKEKKLREVVTNENTQTKTKEISQITFETTKKELEVMKIAGLNEITLTIKNFSEKIFYIKALRMFTIFQVKSLLEPISGVSSADQRLICSGKQLEDKSTLLDYGITDKSIIYLVLRQRGGKPVILLYDDKKKINEAVSVNIKFNEAMDIGATYPEIKTIKESEKIKEYEWKGTYNSDGENNCKITVDGKEVEYLFWEGICLKESEFKGQQIGISQQHFEEELDELLERLGLNERERNDFIVYWITKLGKRKYHLVTICDSKFDKEVASLTVSGFEQTHRVMLKFEETKDLCGLEGVKSVTKRQRPTGKYVIEWGAILA